MTIEEMLAELVRSGLIKPPHPDAVPIDCDNQEHMETSTTDRINPGFNYMGNGTNAKLG